MRRQSDQVAVREIEGAGRRRPADADVGGVRRPRWPGVAGGLAGLGVGRGDRVVLMMRNRLEFHLVDIAVVALGATPISIYNSSSAEQITYLVQHSKAKVAVVEDAFVERVLAAAGDCPGLQSVVALGDAPQGTVGVE